MLTSGVSAAEIKAALERPLHGYEKQIFFPPPPGMTSAEDGASAERATGG